MKFLKEFSYPDIFQRRIMLYNAFFSFTVLGFIYASASILLRYYSPYASIFGIIFLYAFMGLFLGNIAAKLVFNTIKKFRAVYIASDLLFIAACVVFIKKTHFSRERGAAAAPVLKIGYPYTRDIAVHHVFCGF